ncbi:XRE family transcriptional regulator [Psychrobacter sp. 16-MNA-CIBAN-0192]|uniref:helix-turn-helix domain-containing protein n=1 Tax=Psychrobacter sp. 16-MNA-CIBAN-0192 TaxID=3140448 RepID=UPI0033209669
MNTLPDRLKFAREQLNLSQQQVADAVGMKQPSYYQLEAGKSKRSRFINDIAKVLKTNADWLMYGEGDNTPKPSRDELMQRIRDIEDGGARDASNAPKGTVNATMVESSDKVPILSWVAAGSWSNVDSVSFGDALGEVSRPRNLSKNGFALIVRGESMLPKFDPDDIIYVEPETGLFALKNNDLVIVQCNHDTEATFKQLVLGETSDDMYLRPLNPNWHEQKMMPMGDCNLVGKVVGKYVEY